jgi:hypothetical protein
VPGERGEPTGGSGKGGETGEAEEADDRIAHSGHDLRDSAAAGLRAVLVKGHIADPGTVERWRRVDLLGRVPPLGHCAIRAYPARGPTALPRGYLHVERERRGGKHLQLDLEMP